MRLLLALVLVGCASEGHFPPGSGPILPGGSSGQNPVDAGVAAPDAGATGITGRLCAVTDLGTLAPCSALDADAGLAVTAQETGTSAPVGNDGRFALPAAPGRTQLTLVTRTTDVFFGSAMVASLGVGGTTVVTIPVMRQVDVADLAVAAGVAVAPGAGLLVLHTTAGATVDPIDAAIPYYGTGVAGQLSANPPTGSDGLAVFFNLVGPVGVTVRAPAATGTRTIAVTADTLTFAAFAPP